MTSISRSEFKQQIQEMDPTRFEHFVADLWSAQGWNTRLTREHGDRGIDVVATRDKPVSEKHLIQAKRYGPDNPVGSPEIQQYSSLKHQERNVDAVVVVTSGRFSEQAKDIADDLNVKLIDGNDLHDLVRSHDLFEVVDSYIETPEKTDGETGESVDSGFVTVHREDSSSGFSLGWNTATVFGVIGIVIIAVVVGAAGLFAADTSEFGSGGSLSVGESVTYGGLEFAVVNYTIAEQLGDPKPSIDPEDDELPGMIQDEFPLTPDAGAKFVAVKIRVSHVGEMERTFPEDWRLIYQGEQMDIIGTEVNVTVNGRTIEPYDEARSRVGADVGVYPGTTVTGWVVFEVPEKFDPSEAVVRVEYGGRYGPEGVETRTFSWEFESE